MPIDRVRTLGGGRWLLVTEVYLPSVAADVLSSLKVAVGFALAGVIVGEFVAASEGLGYLPSFAQSSFNASLSLVIIGLIMRFVLALIFFRAGQPSRPSVLRRFSPRASLVSFGQEGETTMVEGNFSRADLEILTQWDTPTICNGLEIIVPERRAVGFTVTPMIAADRTYKPIVGLARTGLIRSMEKPRGPIPPREDWYDYVAADGLPTIALLQDIDDRPGFGAFWGEVQSTVHLGLGCIGCVTNGSFRDLDMLAPGFQIIGGSVVPSHAHVHLVQMNCQVNIFGMLANDGDVIHADFHGAVVIPADCVTKLPAAIDLVSRREKVLLDMAKAPGFSSAKMREALRKAGEIH